MAFRLTQTPAAIDAVYGPTIFTLNEPAITDSFYVLEVWDSFPAIGNSVLLATLHQSVNESKSAIFDIQTVLQSYVKVSKDDFDRLGGYDGDQGATPQPYLSNQPKILSDATNESTVYYVRAGSTNSTSIPPTTWDLSSGPFQAFAGVKPWFDRQFDKNDQGLPQDRFTAEVAGNNEGTYNCTYVNDLAQPLSDNRDRLFIQDCGYPYSTGITDNVVIGRHYVSEDDYATKSWINRVRIGNPVPDQFVQGIDGFYVVVYNGANELSNPIIPNMIANGGGPNQTFKEGVATTYPNYFTTIGTGPKNLKFVNYTASNGSAQEFELDDEEWTHYWIYPVVGQVDTLSPNQCGLTVGDANIYPLGEPQLYIKKEPDCLDYDPVQISWLNRFGFRDQYTFRAKNTKTIASARNTYHTPTYNPNAVKWESDPEFRGETTYSMVNKVEFTATTGYISDVDAKTLESLFTSPDVRAEVPASLLNDYPGFGLASFEAVTITNKSYKQKTYRKDRLFQYEVKFRLANNIQSQRG